MSNQVNWKRAFKQAVAVGLILCLGLAVLLGVLLVTNFDNLGRLARVVYLIDTKYLHETTMPQLIDGAIDGIVSSLDPYSSFLDEEENEILMNSIKGIAGFGGIGVIVNTADPNQLVIVRPIKGSPADRAGLEAGDVIIKIDGTSVSTISQVQAVAMMRGEPGTKVTLTVYRPKTNQEFSLSLIREDINVPTVFGSSLPGRPDIALIDISSFSAKTKDEFAQLLKDINIDQYKGLIVDLRFNPGGELNSAIDVAGFLVPEEDIVHIVNNKGEITTKKSTAQYIDKPLVILINEYTASAAEIVSGAVKDYGSGTLVGVKTFGKGVVQTVFPLDGNTSVRLTTDKYLTPNKSDIHNKGIQPDVEIVLKEGEKPTILPEGPPFDSQLAKAVEIMEQMID
ncbi:MAG: S41 family peptidase [Peptococcaceae bacterium]|nr:S41 family peptidase [Peptococcaceae bacterium]